MKANKNKVPSEVLEFLKENIKPAAIAKLLENQNSKQLNRQVFMRLSGKVCFTDKEIDNLRNFLGSIFEQSEGFLETLNSIKREFKGDVKEVF